MIIDVKSLVAKKKEEVKETISKYPENEVKLSIIQVGDNSASNSYIKGKLKDCEEVGIIGDLHKFDENVKPFSILKEIKKLNNDPTCYGIIVQLPLPKQFTKEWIEVLTNTIDRYKDVDGFRKDSPFTPCTPKGIMSIIDYLWEQIGGSTLNGVVACVIGRSEIVGKPTVNLLIDRGCTVVNCNSHTRDLDFWLDKANIIITATGSKDLLNMSRHVNWKEKIVIDVGINRDENGKLCGDCSKDLYDEVKWITPVPGGVGLMTRVSLLENVVQGL